MKFGVSNIGWDFEKNDEIFEVLQKNKISYVEIAPTKICDWDDKDLLKKIKSYKKKLKKYNLKACGLQSIFFNKNINIFKEPNKFIQHFKHVIEIGKLLDVKYIVYGSPKTRVISEGDNLDVFINSFIEISKIDKNINICIEPNPEEYGCNFITNMIECENIVKKINKTNIKTHIDISEVIINSENIENFDLNICETAHISNQKLQKIKKEYNHLYNKLFTLNLKFTTLESLKLNNKKDIEEQLSFIKST
jgi:sugar phosphate isomerase/epimerase